MPWFFVALLAFIGAVALYKVIEILGSMLLSLLAMGLVLLAIPTSLMLSVFVAYWVLRAIGATLFSSDNTFEEDPYHYMNYGDLYDADDKRARAWRDD